MHGKVRQLAARLDKTAVIVLSAFLVETGIGMAALGLIFYVRDIYGLPAGTVGWFGATWLISYLFGCIFMRSLMERIRARDSVILAVTCMAIFIFAIFRTSSVALSFVLYALYGIAMSFFWPPLMGWLSSGAEGSALGAAMAKLTVAGSVGMIVSPFLAGLLSERGPTIPGYAAIGLFCTTVFLGVGSRLLSPRTYAGAIQGPTRQELSLPQDRSTLLRYPAWAGFFGNCVIVGVVFNIFPMYARTDLGIDKSTVGILLLIRAFGAAVGYLILGKTKFWHFKSLLMVAGLSAMLLLVLALPWIHSIWLLGCLMTLLGLLHSVAFSYSFFHGASGSNRRAQRMAIHESLLAAGIITGSTVGGMVYEHYSMLAVCLFVAALILLIVVSQVVLNMRSPERASGRTSRNQAI